MAGISWLSSRSRFLLAICFLLIFTPPVFSVLVFFCPLIVSTALAVLAMFSLLEPCGYAARRDDEISDDRMAGPDLVGLPAVTTETISNVLMIGNQEVTWLEWLHNEDLEKSRAQELMHGMPENWDSEELDVAVEACPSIFYSEDSVADPFGCAVSCESLTGKYDGNVAETPKLPASERCESFPSNHDANVAETPASLPPKEPCDGISSRSQLCSEKMSICHHLTASYASA